MDYEMKYELLKAYLQGIFNSDDTFSVIKKEDLFDFIKKIEEK